MKLTDLYKELRDPRGFCNGEAVPSGLYEARNILVQILNNCLKDYTYEAYSVDILPDTKNDSLHSDRNIYRIMFRPKEGPYKNHINMFIGSIALDILKEVEEDWEIHTTISVCRRD